MIINTEILLIVTIYTQTSQSSRKSVLNVHWKDWCWGWSSNTLATWCEELTHLKKHWYWERLKAGGEGNDRGWDGWMASPTRWTWVRASSGSWWWTGKPGVLQSMRSHTRVRHDGVTELNWKGARQVYNPQIVLPRVGSLISALQIPCCVLEAIIFQLFL